MITKEMLFEIRESYDNPRKMYRQILFVVLIMAPFFIMAAVFNEPMFLLLEIPVFLGLRFFLFGKILDERHLEIQKTSTFIGFNLSLIFGLIGGILLVIYSGTDLILFYIGFTLAGFSLIQLFIHSLVEAYYRAKLSGEKDE